jgi:hypothetical protein
MHQNPVLQEKKDKNKNRVLLPGLTCSSVFYTHVFDLLAITFLPTLSWGSKVRSGPDVRSKYPLPARQSRFVPV